MPLSAVFSALQRRARKLQNQKNFLFWNANFFKVCGRKRGGENQVCSSKKVRASFIIRRTIEINSLILGCFFVS
jgi:hypothetical protein